MSHFSQIHYTCVPKTKVCNSSVIAHGVMNLTTGQVLQSDSDNPGKTDETLCKKVKF